MVTGSVVSPGTPSRLQPNDIRRGEVLATIHLPGSIYNKPQPICSVAVRYAECVRMSPD